MGRYNLVVLFLLPVFLFGCGGKEGLLTGEETVIERGGFSTDQEGQTYDIFPKYHISPGDILDVLYQIKTWIKKDKFTVAVDHTISVKFPNSPGLNETQRIRPDGTISLPYLGSVYVIDRTLDDLADYLKIRYKEILRDPELYIVVPEFRSRIKELKKDLHTAPRGLSRLVTVRPDGYATFPMLGDVLVSSKTVPEVREILNKRYDEILPGLHCDLFLERHSGTVVYVVGQVYTPGAHRIRKPITVIEALALSGGYRYSAKLQSVLVIRKLKDKIIATKINVKNTLELKGDGSLFYLKPDDIVYVPKRNITKLAEISRDIADIAFFRGWSVGFSWELHKEPTKRADDN